MRPQDIEDARREAVEQATIRLRHTTDPRARADAREALAGLLKVWDEDIPIPRVEPQSESGNRRTRRMG